jgi:hypothetical protein
MVRVKWADWEPTTRSRTPGLGDTLRMTGIPTVSPHDAVTVGQLGTIGAGV